MKRLSLLAWPALALVLAACGSSSSSSSTASSAAPPAPPASASPPSSGGAAASGSTAVAMQNTAFSPTTLQAKVGETIKWTNKDSFAHNVTYVGGPSFVSSANIDNGGTFSVRLTKAGTIQYRCTIHPGMNGTIVVAP